jgi:AcrR family transcriptional regulator
MVKKPVNTPIDLIGRQAAKSKATQDKIINAVIGIIKENGFAAASSTQIAKKAGVTWGAVQHHFGGKDEILEEVLERSQLKFYDTLNAPRFTVGTVEKRVAKYVDAAWVHYQGDEYMASLEILLATRGHGKPGSDLAVIRSKSVYIELSRRIFYDSGASNKDMLEAMYIVHCMLTGILIEVAIEPAGFNARAYIRRIKAIVKEILY